MSSTQFAKSITLLKRICDLIRQVRADSATPQYNSTLIELFNATQALTGVRPTTMSEVRSALESMSRDFYDYIQQQDVLRRMGRIDYLLPSEGGIGAEFRHNFIHKYLSDARNSMSGAFMAEASRILDRCPFYQGEMDPAECMDNLLMRNPDLTQTTDGFVSIRPSYLFRYPNGSKENIGLIQGNNYTNGVLTYASDDSLYFVVRSNEAFTANVVYNAVVTAVASHVYFFGTVEVCQTVDDRLVGLAGATSNMLLSSTVHLPAFRLRQGAAVHHVGTKFQYGIKLESNVDIVFPNNVDDYPATARGIVLRFKGRFYVNKCGYGAIQKSDNLQSGQVDSWNHEFDALRLTILTSAANCTNDVMTTITTAYSNCINLAIVNASIAQNPARIIIDDFSDLSRVLANILEATDDALGLTVAQRQKVCMLATTLHVIYCTFMAWYSPV